MTFSKSVLDTPVSSPSRKRQLAQIPLSSCVVAPHFWHFAGLLVALGRESESPSGFFIKVNRFRQQGRHKGTGSRLRLGQGRRPSGRLHPAIMTGNAAADCAAVL